MRPLLRRVVLIALAVCATALSSAAQNVMHVRVDTLTAQPGDTVFVNVLYTFQATRGHNVHDFVARFLFDSSDMTILGYQLAGTASAAISFIQDTTIGDHTGLVAVGNLQDNEIDLTDSVLFRMRVAIPPQLADTAWIRWDTNWAVFDVSDSVDSVVREDGWVRTPSTAGHISLAMPSVRADTGQSVRVPVLLGDVHRAGISAGVLRFVIDTMQLPVRNIVAGTPSDAVLQAWSIYLDTVSITLHAGVGGVIAGDDTLVFLTLHTSPRQDTACLMPVIEFDSVQAKYTGNVSAAVGNICVVPGLSGPSSVSSEMPGLPDIGVFPNPARNEVTFLHSGDALRFDGGAQLHVFDAVGRRVYSAALQASVWRIPPSLTPGVYEIVLQGDTWRWMGTLLIEPR